MTTADDISARLRKIGYQVVGCEPAKWGASGFDVRLKQMPEGPNMGAFARKVARAGLWLSGYGRRGPTDQWVTVAAE